LRRRLPRALPLVALVVLAAGCSGVGDLPDDDVFSACLESAGVDPGSIGGAEERRDAFSDPAALACVADLESATDQQDVLAGVFTDEQLWPVLQEWIGTRDEAAEVLARETGELLGAADGDEEDDFGEAWSEEQLNENLALAIAEHADGPPASYQTWLDDPEAQQSVSDSDPLSAGSQYLNWLEEPAHGDQETAAAIRTLQDTIRETRQA